MKKNRYGTIMLLTSLQYANHLREYFVENSKKTIAFYVLPRKGNIDNFVEIYQDGEKVEKHNLYSPRNIFFWYLFLYIHYVFLLFRYTKRGEKVFFINYLFPLYFGYPLIRVIRNISFVAWVGDYWPMKDFSIRFYMFFLRYYHSKVDFAFYQTDRINRGMNGKLVNTKYKKKIIPAVDPPQINFSKKIANSITLCFIGVLVPWQGIDLLLEVVAKNPKLRLRLIGTGEQDLVSKYKKIIKDYGIEKRVYFPNKFIYGAELKKEIASSHIGIGLYEVDKMSVTYYGDPAKIKQYMEYGLPIIMTNAAEAASYIHKYQAGIVVEKNRSAVEKAIKEISKHYKKYLHNLDTLNHALDYRTYYPRKFKFMEI